MTDAKLGNVILELKALETVGEEQRKQLWSYLCLTNCPFGMLINFSPKGVFLSDGVMTKQLKRSSNDLKVT